MEKTKNEVMASIESNVSVGMGEVVNVFLAQYENRLHAEREAAQKEISVLNKQIQETTDQSLIEFNTFMNQSDLGSLDNGFVTVTVKLRPDPIVHMDKGYVQSTMETTLTSKSTLSNDGSYKKDTSYVNIQVLIEIGLVQRYKDLMVAKNEQTSLLAKINADLRDINRKERQIRGRIAEMKLKDMGMEQLLIEPTLLQLISESGM